MTLSRFLPFLIIIFLVLIFFNKTLIGTQVFATPDFGLSDILNIEYPTKFFLSESLKNHQLPLWDPNVATGFPQSSVTSGFFNPINIILFYFLPAHLAFHIGFATIFLTAAIFTLLYCRSIGLSKIASTLGAIVFAFSGVFATQIVHFSVIQTLSVFPLMLYLAEIYLQKRKLFILILLSLALGIQILTGFYQVILNGLIILGIYIFSRIFFFDQKLKSQSFQIITSFIIAVFVGFLMASVQLLPSLEFTRTSTRSEGARPDEVKLFPYPIKHLAAFVWPYTFGDPRKATYPEHSENWGIFWENTGYVGILPLIFTFYAILARRKNKYVNLLLVTAILSLLLMLGKNSPTFFLFQIPPLSFFRVPARWIMFLTFSISILSAIGFELILERLKSKISSANLKIIANIFLLVAIVDLFFFSYNYNLRVPANWLNLPQTAHFLKKDNSLFRIESLGNYIFWDNQFLKKGWLNQPENYLTFLQNLDPNWNTVHKITHVGIYAIIQTKRDQIISTIRNQHISFTGNGLNINDITRTVYDFQSVKYIISPLEISSRDLEIVSKTQSSPPYFIYQNKTVLPRVFIVQNWEFAPTPQEQFRILSSKNFDPKKSVILEKNIAQQFKLNNWQADITKYNNQNVEIKASLDGNGILILTDSYYPGWKAQVDGKDSEILPANINQRAIILEPGDHLIRFIYEPKSFKNGVAITLTTSVFLLVFLSFTIFKRDKLKLSD